MIYKDWDYKPQKNREDAYEHLFETELSTDVEQLFNQIRDINVFPIYYFTEDGIDEEIQSVINKNNVAFIDDVLYTSSREGLLLLDFLFPNLHEATTCNINSSMFDRFYNDEDLKFCLKKHLEKTTKIFNMRTLFFSVARFYWDTPTNFNPIRAKAIFERFCPKNGVIYDYSAGYGGRMLGALSSQQNFTYIGTDPNTATYENLKILGEKIERNTKRKNSYSIYNIESENLELEKESVDFCFSCPPFFNKEIYCEEATQSISKYPKYNDWLEQYVRPTIRQCFNAVKPNGIYGVDIMNYYLAGKQIPLVKDWCRIAEEEGFYFYKDYEIASRVRKQEPEKIYIFTKQKDAVIIDYTPNEIYNESLNHKKELKYKQNRRNKTIIGEYDIFGNLINTYNKDEIDIDTAYKKSKIIQNNEYYYKIYRGDDIVQRTIEVKQPIAKIKDKYFYTYQAIGDYAGVSKQASHQSHKRHGKKIGGLEVIWYGE